MTQLPDLATLKVGTATHFHCNDTGRQLALQTIAAGGVDFFGQVAAGIGALDARMGQFFTPYEVSRMMAIMTLGDVAARIEAQGFITIPEPAAGAGGIRVSASVDAALRARDRSELPLW